ncbi:MAG: respiratory nitrate reductase subunit gamma [Chitinivibrionia bacterium]|nr:respiratory nitrate reductase subunit gamma [Chitinivibrionia bacterium]
MSTYAFIVGGVLPGIAALTFIIGMTYRFRVWSRTVQPGKMTLFPASDNTIKAVLAEAVFFPGLFRGDRVLWMFAWIFHATLALVFLGHLRVFTGLVDRILAAMGLSADAIAAMSNTVGGIAGVVLLATGIMLLIRRVTLQRAKEISGLPDFFALLLIIAIILTGNMMRFGPHFELEQTRVWARSLITFSPAVPQNGLFLTHALLAIVLIMYIPFSKILHFGGIFFTQSLIKRR